MTSHLTSIKRVDRRENSDSKSELKALTQRIKESRRSMQRHGLISVNGARCGSESNSRMNS